MTFVISILDKRQQPSTRVSFVFSRPHPLFSLGLACHFPRFDCPVLGQQHLSPVTLRSAVLAGDFFLQLLISHLLCCGRSFLLMTFYVSLLCVLFMLQCICLAKHCAWYFTIPLLSIFRPLMPFLSFLSPFLYLLLLPSFFPLSFSVLVFISCLTLSFLTSPISPLPCCIFLLRFFPPHFSFAHCPPHPFSWLPFTYIYVYTYVSTPLQVLHSPAETKKCLMLIVWSYCISFSAPELRYSCPSSNTCIG